MPKHRPKVAAPVDVGDLIDALHGARTGKLLVVTGAGVSLASGLPTFRGVDEGAVWSNDVMERGTLRFFLEHPHESWTWYLQRFACIEGASPNPAHCALADLERLQTESGGQMLLVTQNIDGLHRAAGSLQLVEVHGRADRVRCIHPQCEKGGDDGSIDRALVSFDALTADSRAENVPVCSVCGSMVRPHVLWFDESYTSHRDYQIERVLRATKHAHLVVFIGTSFSVGVTEYVMRTALAKGVPMVNLDPSGRSPHPRVRVLAAPAEEVLPQVVSGLMERGR